MTWSAALSLLGACGTDGQSRGAGRPSGHGPSGYVSAASAPNSPITSAAEVPAAGPATHPCSLITAAQVDQVMGAQFPVAAPVNVGTDLACRTQSASVTLSWGVVQQGESPGTSTTVESHYRAAVPVRGLGGKAYCTPNTGLIYSVHLLQGTTEFSVDADTCAHAEALARLAAGRL